LGDAQGHFWSLPNITYYIQDNYFLGKMLGLPFQNVYGRFNYWGGFLKQMQPKGGP
jgi:hypothetical protein